MLGFHFRISQPLMMNFWKPFTTDTSLYPGLQTRCLRQSVIWWKYLFLILLISFLVLLFPLYPSIHPMNNPVFSNLLIIFLLLLLLMIPFLPLFNLQHHHVEVFNILWT